MCNKEQLLWCLKLKLQDTERDFVIRLNHSDVSRITLKVHSCKAVWPKESVISVLGAYEPPIQKKCGKCQFLHVKARFLIFLVYNCDFVRVWSGYVCLCDWLYVSVSLLVTVCVCCVCVCRVPDGLCSQCSLICGWSVVVSYFFVLFEYHSLFVSHVTQQLCTLCGWSIECLLLACCDFTK